MARRKRAAAAAAAAASAADEPLDELLLEPLDEPLAASELIDLEEVAANTVFYSKLDPDRYGWPFLTWRFRDSTSPQAV
jgi:hypothetical protein